MKNLLRRTHWTGTLIGFCLALVIFLAVVTPTLHSDPPGLVGGPLTNGAFGITITNGSATGYYQIEGRDGLEPEFNWRVVATSEMGQTNFSIPTGPALRGFYRALNCLDCDLDGVPNTSDAHPGDTNIGVLTITITSPANGGNIY